MNHEAARDRAKTPIWQIVATVCALLQILSILVIVAHSEFYSLALTGKNIGSQSIRSDLFGSIGMLILAAAFVTFLASSIVSAIAVLTGWFRRRH